MECINGNTTEIDGEKFLEFDQNYNLLQLTFLLKAVDLHVFKMYNIYSKQKEWVK